MRRSTLALLCCPGCHAELALRAAPGDGTVETGSLFCARCRRSFPIEDGVAQFIDRQELEGPNRRFARFYDRLSPFYALFIKVAFLPFGGERKARKEILDRLDLGGRVLEVSIGPGVNLPFLFESSAVDEVYGLDISAGQLARCRRFVARRGWPVELFLGTAEALPFPADAFDSVFHIGGINFFSNRKQAMAEMIRVARPGSKIVVADETERVARRVERIAGSADSHEGRKQGWLAPADLVPDGMEALRVDGIWQAHGQYHGYCLTFRKPA